MANKSNQVANAFSRVFVGLAEVVYQIEVEMANGVTNRVRPDTLTLCLTIGSEKSKLIPLKVNQINYKRMTENGNGVRNGNAFP